MKIALRACRHYGVDLSRLHLDASSFGVHGACTQSEAAEADEGVIRITHGYSREQQSDLKQFLVDLPATMKGCRCFLTRPVAIPATLGTGSSDKEGFAEVVVRYRKPLDLEALFMADSALYSRENLQALSGLRYLTRAPLTLKEAKAVVDELDAADFSPSSISGYRIAERQSDYGGIKQCWLMVESEAASARRGAPGKRTQAPGARTRQGVTSPQAPLLSLRSRCAGGFSGA